MTGYTIAEIQSLYHQNYMEIIDERDRQNVITQMQTQLTKGGRYEVQYRLCLKDGGYRWVTEAGYWTQSQRSECVGVLTDITKLVQKQEQLAPKQWGACPGSL